LKAVRGVDYMTVKEAGEKWGLGSRIVTLYCAEGRIAGAMKKGNLWLVPRNAVKPTDGRRKKIVCQKEKETVIYQDPDALPEQRPDRNIPPFQSVFENKELFVEIIKHFPYPMHIMEADGTIIFANEAFLKFVKVAGLEEISRKHNVLQDLSLLERWGVKEITLRAFRGEIVRGHEVKVPLQELIERFSGDKELVLESLYDNMTLFPIYDDHHQLQYVVCFEITSKSYQDKEEIIKGKEYLDDHWREEFDFAKMAGTVNLSKYYYTRLFKKHTGMTPYGYYQEVKIGKLKEKLGDKNLSITQAFADCGVDYNGYFARTFKEKVGMTPSQYRMSLIQK
jgi:AraC-type DNA-binding domain-containing proteins